MIFAFFVAAVITAVDAGVSRWQECVIQQGFTHGGRWVLDKAADPITPALLNLACGGREEISKSCGDGAISPLSASSSSQWDWETASPGKFGSQSPFSQILRFLIVGTDCALHHMKTGDLQSIFERLSIRNVVFIGDSLMGAFFHSILFIMNGKRDDQGHSLVGHIPLSHGSMNLTFVHSPIMIENSWTFEQDKAVARAAGSANAEAFKIAADIRRIQPELIIVNWGAHYSSATKNFSRVNIREMYRSHARSMAIAVRGALLDVAVMTNNDTHTPLVLWRPTSQGHLGCGEIEGKGPHPAFFGGGAEALPEETAKAVEVAKYHNWDLFDSFNQDFAGVWSEFFDFKTSLFPFSPPQSTPQTSSLQPRPRVVTMDVTDLSRTRGDLHTKLDAPQLRKANPELRDDCLHFNRPVSYACSNETQVPSSEHALKGCTGSGLVEMSVWEATLLFNFLEAPIGH